MIISLSFLLRIRNVSDRNYRENLNTHFVLVTFFESLAACEIRWEKCGRAGQAANTSNYIVRRMRFECCITKATNPHSEYVMLFPFSRQHGLRERNSVYGHCLVACCRSVVVGCE
jgi:hypothetical protein